MQVPPLDTPRLQVRPFVMADLEAVYQLLDVELADTDTGTDGVLGLDQRRAWLEWTVLNYQQLAYLYQPPYGDRAIVLKEDGRLIGSCGYVPCLNVFDQIPALTPQRDPTPPYLNSPEFGLYWAISPACQGQGYATEAAIALVNYAFEQLQLRRIVATTAYENKASQGVMRKLGMRLEHNPFPDPPWLQVVGILENPKLDRSVQHGA